MTTYSYKDLITTLTADDIATAILAGLTAKGYDVTSWSEMSIQKMMITSVATGLALVASQIPMIAKGGVLGQSSGLWLDALGQTFFGLPRNEAVHAVRKLRITDAGGVGPITKSGGTVWIKSVNGTNLRYTNEDFTLPKNGYVDVLFTAENGGTAYNGTTGGYSYVTTIPGTTIADAPSGAFPTQGQDQEQDAAYTDRLAEWFGALAITNATDGAYASMAKAANSQVTRVSVLRVTPSLGHVTTLVAGASGSTLSNDVVTAVQSYITARVPTAEITHHTTAASPLEIALSGTITVAASELSTATAAGLAALAAFESTCEIGASVSKDIIVSKLLAGVTNPSRCTVSLTTPAADVTLDPDEIPQFDTTSLTWVGA